jgi:hypothetical protein
MTRPPQGQRVTLQQALDIETKLWIESAKDGPVSAREALGHLAGRLRMNRLGEEGRLYLADALEKIALGGDPADLLPRRRKSKKYSSEDILGAVEREKRKLGQPRADRFIYDAVGRRFGIKGSTAAKEASLALSRIRQWYLAQQKVNEAERGVTGFSSEIHDDLLLNFEVADKLDIEWQWVPDLLFGPQFER